MVPKFEKRVRAFAMEISPVVIALIIVTFGFGEGSNTLKYTIVFGAYFFITIFPIFLKDGQTFGKRIQQIKVVNMDGTKTSKIVLILRELFKTFASLFTFGIYSIVAFFAITEKEASRTIHDYIFRTKMIDLEKPTNKKRDDHFLGTSESLKKRGL